ncbi:MAG: gamma-glutamyltransferase [Candidatus Eremiobacteraeota bacterium]|nr:gamma-glutamyltransferase [Candidatus Eremiobacteraeota bacterium]
MRQPRLAATLRALSQQGRDWFYLGAGAEQVGRSCERVGSPLRVADLAVHRGFFYAPAQAPFLSYDSLTTAPNSQGIALLIAQRVFEECNRALSAPEGSAASVHAMVEAIKLAFAERDRHVADAQVGPPWDQLVRSLHVRKLAARIDPYLAMSEPAAHGEGDTAYFCVVDERRNAASYIQSLFHSFGSGVMIPELGILLNNRGSAFSLAPDSLRTLQPGRRPFHTLMPCMLCKNGRPWLVYGSMGGEGQPQTALQLSTRIARFAMDPQAAIEAPRWRWGQSYIGEAASLHLESRFGTACIAALRARGHTVNVVGEWDEAMGHAGAIVVEADGVLHGGADPRGDGAAVGW